MIFNIFFVATLAGTALAACPLSIAITDTLDHVAQVTLENIGNDTITIYKGNTILSEQATMDLEVTDANGNPLPFQGIYVTYKSNGVTADMFQTLAPGESVISFINAAKTYNLAGINTAQITAVQGFRYIVGATAPTVLHGMETCETISSNTVTITPDQHTVSTDLMSHQSTVRSRVMKRATTYSSCSASQLNILKNSVKHAATLAGNAYNAANTAADYFTVWFKTTSNIAKVRSIYLDIYNIESDSPGFSCVDTYGDCTQNRQIVLFTVPSTNMVYPCPDNGFYELDEYAPSCADALDRAGAVLHEFSHIFGTLDNAYYNAECKKLSAQKAVENADTYRIYAGSVRLGGCS